MSWKKLFWIKCLVTHFIGFIIIAIIIYFIILLLLLFLNYYCDNTTTTNIITIIIIIIIILWRYGTSLTFSDRFVNNPYFLQILDKSVTVSQNCGSEKSSNKSFLKLFNRIFSISTTILFEKRKKVVFCCYCYYYYFYLLLLL